MFDAHMCNPIYLPLAIIMLASAPIGSAVLIRKSQATSH